MTARSWITTVLLATVTVAGCGDNMAAPDTRIHMSAGVVWDEAPASSADIGYVMGLSIWPVAEQSRCVPARPILRVTVNDREAESLGTHGDCNSRVSYLVRGIVDDGPISIRVADGDQIVADAMFEGVFPGLQARLVSPTDGRVAPGGELVVTVPPGFRGAGSPPAQFYWRDVPPNVPAFYTRSSGSWTPDGSSLTVRAPDGAGLSGRAALIIQGYDAFEITSESCTGVWLCRLSVAHVAGPIEVEVVPAQAAR